MKKLADVEVIRECNGEFPDWKVLDVSLGIFGGVDFETPDMCRECDFFMQCRQRFSQYIKQNVLEITCDTLKNEELMAKVYKVTQMLEAGDITPEVFREILMEAQEISHKRNNSDRPLVN